MCDLFFTPRFATSQGSFQRHFLVGTRHFSPDPIILFVPSAFFIETAVVDTVHCQRENKKISKKLVNSITIKSHGLF